MLSRMTARLLLIACASMTVASSVLNTPGDDSQEPFGLHFSNVPQENYAWLDSVKLWLYRCARDFDDGTTITFYLVGEVHLYNSPASRFADTLLERLRPGLFLTEGADTAISSEFRSKLSALMREIGERIDHDQPGLGKLASDRGIPIVPLEEIDESTGAYIGISESEKVSLEQAIIMFNLAVRDKRFKRIVQTMLDDPKKFSAVATALFQQSGLDSSTWALPQVAASWVSFDPKSGIIDKRNEAMTATAIEYISPENGCILVRVGAAHVAGIIEGLSQHGCGCKYVPLREFLDSGS